MGCGSSTAQPLDPVVPAAAVKPKGGASSAAPLKPLPVQVEQQGAASAGQQQQQPPPVADTPRTKQQKQKLRKHSGEGDEVGAQGAASPSTPAAELPPPPPCDADPAHEAVFWCAQCEESLCAACDAAAHTRDASHRHEHRRTKLGEAGGSKRKSDGGSSPKQPKSKFVVRSTAPVTPAGSVPSPRGGEVAADASATPAAGGSGTPKFKVSKFASEESTPSPAGPGSSAAARIKHSPTGAGQGGALGSLEESELSRMTRGELELLWHRYDKDRNNVLDRGELRRLAADVIARLLQLVRDDLREKQPHRSEEELDELVAREKLFVLPGKDVKETQKHMTNTLQKTLDINSDGKVTKQEYLSQWNVFAADVFQLKQEGALECCIM